MISTSAYKAPNIFELTERTSLKDANATGLLGFPNCDPPIIVCVRKLPYTSLTGAAGLL